MSAKDVQDLLRMLTTGRNKLTLPAAMARVKALQSADLRSISSIASADLATITQAISDEKAAKALQTACKNTLKSPADKKRSASTDAALSPPSKRSRSAYELMSEPQTPQELEAALALPLPSEDEEAISRTTVFTNRAPLVLAFALQLLKYTMPEQPLSSRLSLAQAVVSVNSSSKARSLGIEKGVGAEQMGWGAGQPKVRVLGREIHVLKRGGYEWRAEENVKRERDGEETAQTFTSAEETSIQASDTPVSAAPSAKDSPTWSTSATVTSKKSTFVARCISITTAAQARSQLQALVAAEPTLRTADHNITAWRLQTSNGNVIEECSDDGESGGGRHVLEILQSSAITGVFVVVTRWYGGIMLGPDRWRIMTQVCRDALSQRLRVSGIIGQEALWGLDLEAMRRADAPVTGGQAAGMPIYSAESARAYIMKAFSSPPASAVIGTGEDENGTAEAKKQKKKSGAALDRERVENLGLLLGALDMLLGSWVEHISRDELDRRAWTWYVQVRPEVESGISGWGGKADVRLSDILALRRKG
ncbi:hypothetical protein BP5796_00274 [Coleophoma crateriformis]|uniref:Impact N-terminal domain-containing protein n=1 Tax=Coleophoma crateriformis TaxID=565419 RepID=A0A3D8T7U8_9HELO|nr:hypothetical protein BP5796_00274 [Coleophoma crateriformis]